jgi:hypothetical protein
MRGVSFRNQMRKTQSRLKVTESCTHDRLQLTRATKRGDGERNKHQANDDGNTDQPVRGVSRPRTQRHVEPAEGEDGKNRADGFME